MEASLDVVAWEKIIKSSPDLICTLDRNGCYKNINEACENTFGLEREDFIGKPFSALVHPDDLDLTRDSFMAVVNGRKVNNFKNRKISKSGSEIYIQWSGVYSPEEEVMLCVGRDITEQELSRQRDELHQALLEIGSDMLALFDADLTFKFSGTSTIKKMGWEPEQLIGTNAFDFIHPDDLPSVKDALSKGLPEGGSVKISDFRFKDAKGKWRWLETVISNQLVNPAIKALVASSIDITERVSSRMKLQESEQRFRSLFDHHLDIVLFQDVEGIIRDVNPATTSFFELRREEILNRPLSDFICSNVADTCILNLQEALKGEPVRVEMEVPYKDKGVFIFDVSKIPVEVDGEIIGVYSIIRDITEFSRSNKIIRRQAEKLNNIMESITDAFFTLDKNWIITYANKELEKLFATDRRELPGKSFWDLAEKSIIQNLYNNCFKVVETGKAASFETYLEGDNKWVQVRAFPSEEGLSVFLDDITEKVKSQQELEKLSLVANKTTNGVVILDADGITEWVNEGFTKLTGYSFSEVAGINSCKLLQGEETDFLIVKSIQERIQRGKPFKEELVNYKKSGEKMWLLLDMTPVLNEAGEVTKLIIIQTDITFKKETEAARLELTKDLFRQNKDLQQFSYIVSHNLRSPVANAMGLIEIINSGDKSPESLELPLTYLKTSVHQLDAVLRDLNTILSIRDKKEPVENRRIELLPVFQQALEDFKDVLKACGGEVDIEVDQKVLVKGNKAYLHSIFHNLLSNAIKYRSENRSLKVRIKCISNSEKGTVISFSDNGSGFDMELAGDKLFKLYKRFHTRSEGRGLGLFLIKTHIEALEGHIEVTSTVNKGTKFLIYLK